MSRVFCQYVKANKKNKKDHDEHKDQPYLTYCNENNLCGWAMSQMSLVNVFNPTWAGLF